MKKGLSVDLHHVVAKQFRWYILASLLWTVAIVCFAIYYLHAAKSFVKVRSLPLLSLHNCPVGRCTLWLRCGTDCEGGEAAIHQSGVVVLADSRRYDHFGGILSKNLCEITSPLADHRLHGRSAY